MSLYDDNELNSAVLRLVNRSHKTGINSLETGTLNR